MDTVVKDQEGLRGVLNQVVDQRPNLPCRDPVAFQEVADHIMADIFQMFRQVLAGVIDRGADQYSMYLCLLS